MDMPARPEVSCLSLTIQVIKEFTTITMHRTELASLQRRSDGVNLNNLGSTGKRFWLSLRRAPLLKSRFKAGSSRGKG